MNGFNIEEIILLIGGFMAFFLSFIIAFRFSKNNIPANYFLVLFLVVLFLTFILKLTDKPDRLSTYIHLSKLNYPLGLLRPILFFLYFYHFTHPGEKFKWKEVFHFVPFLILVIYFLPYYLLSANEKIALGNMVTAGGKWQLPAWYNYLGLVYAVIYFILSLIQFKRFNEGDNKIYLRDFKRIRSWLLLMLAGYVLFILLALVSRQVTSLEYYPFLGLSLFVIIAGAVMLSFPDLSAEEKKKEKYTRLSLSNTEKTSLLEKIKYVLQTEKLYKQDNLRLATLAEKMQLPEYVVSNLVNEVAGLSFSAFINSYRIETAKKLLKDPAYFNFTIESIGYEVGFYSRASFYNAFKKETGLSPAEFKKI